MSDHVVKTGMVVLVLVSFFLVGPVSAAINTITTGSIVFIGEDGLDITSAVGGDSRIGWWASGASVTTTSPDYSIPVSNPANFYVSPTDFVSHTGVWYRLNSLGTVDGTAFTVVDPRLDLKIQDTTVDVDVTDKWVPNGDSISFRIETNLVSISQRPGVSSTPITIKVQSPDGAIYTSLVNSAGISTSTVDIPVTSTPYLTGSIWDTGRVAMYPTGTYTIWAECNVNFMNDRYVRQGKPCPGRSAFLIRIRTRCIIPRHLLQIPPLCQPSCPPCNLLSHKPYRLQRYPQRCLRPLTVTITTAPSQIPSPTPTQTKSPGFEGVLAGAAIIIALVLSIRKV